MSPESVALLRGDDAPDAAARARRVATGAWDEVEVHDGLACRLAAIHPHVVAVRLVAPSIQAFAKSKTAGNAPCSWIGCDSTINMYAWGVVIANLFPMATPRQHLASRKRHQILNEFFFADRFDPFSKSEFRSIFNAFKSEGQIQVSSVFSMGSRIADPDLGWSDAFEAEFELEGTLDDGIHTPVTITILGECPPVRPLDMRLQMDDCEPEEITGFYDFAALQHFLDTLEYAKQLHAESEESHQSIEVLQLHTWRRDQGLLGELRFAVEEQVKVGVKRFEPRAQRHRVIHGNRLGLAYAVGAVCRLGFFGRTPILSTGKMTVLLRILSFATIYIFT